MNNENGRVNILGPNIESKFSMMDKIPLNSNTSYLDSLTGVFERSKLSDTFFSNKNIIILQNGIRKGVYDKSDGNILIDYQSSDELAVIMRSIYLQCSQNQSLNISQQIETLNKKVLDYCINNVYNEAVAYLNYKRDASEMYKPLPNPIHTDKTNKTMEYKSWF